MSSVGSEAGSEGSNTSRNGEIVKTGFMKKLKTMKKKFFVLRADSPSFPACLEYYDSGKKWKNKHPPKRNIILKNCFNVNRRTDTKHKYVIALFSGSDCFGIVLECEDDLQEWLRLLLMYQQGEDGVDSTSLKPYYEHVWRVTVQKKELASKHNMSGVHLICLTDCTLSLVKPAAGDDQEGKFYEFHLPSIRRCGNLDTFFYMEFGQASCLGSGNLWMQAEDSHTAQHMHSIIMNACTNCPKKEIPQPTKGIRGRSSSANEASKPVGFGRKWPSTGDDSLSVLSYPKAQCQQEQVITSPNSGSHSASSVGDGIHHYHHNLTSVSFPPYPPARRASTGTRPVTTGPALLSSGRTSKTYTGRERCDSLPTRPRMILDTLLAARGGNTVSYSTAASGRPTSMYNRGIFSPPGCSHPTSPISATYSTDSAGSSLSVDVESENWSEMELRKVILEENPEDYVQWGGNRNKNFLAENIPPNNGSMCSRSIKSICAHSSSNSQGSCSPCSSSPMDAGTYIPMSPIESVIENRARLLLNHSCDSVNHSRESSIHEDIGEGYVPMAPLSVDAGYISMDQSGRKQAGDLSPGLSSCSITSGTPSTDCRFSEFHLDKVSSYLTPSDDDIIFNMRPTRAYSTGSKPDASHKFISCDSSDGMRTRAFSVGSRCSSNFPTTPRRTANSTSTSSIEPCDDLVEIDFSPNKLRRRHLHTRVKHQPKGVVHTSAEKLTVPHSAATLSAYSAASDTYIDMSPKAGDSCSSFTNESRVSDANLSPPRIKHLIGRSPATTSTTIYFKQSSFTRGSPGTTASGLLEKVVESESHGSKHASATVASDDANSYMDMKPGVCDMPDSVTKVTPVIATATNLHARKESFTLLDPVNMRQQTTCSTLPHIKQPLLETDGKQFKSNFNESKSDKQPANGTVTSTSTPEGYIDMTFKSRRNSDSQPAKTAEKTPDGYVDMTFKNSRKNLVDSNSAEGSKKTENRPQQCFSGKENQVDVRQCSKPIAIQQSKNKRSGGGSSFFRRYKSGEETTQQATKPNFLPLVTFASLGRKKKGCQKKNKTESSASGTIFPLSPDRMPSLDYDPNSKCAITASGESVRLTGDFEIRSLDRVDEMANWPRNKYGSDEGADEAGENCDYIVMTPGMIPRLQRKVSEPTCPSYSISRTTNGKEETTSKDSSDSRTLYRSTSVPSTVSGMRGLRWSPSTCEFTQEDDEKSRSDGSMNSRLSAHSMEVDETASSEAPLSQANVPNASTFTDVLRSREKVMYATLDLPQSGDDVSTNEEPLSSAKPDQSDLTYAQIDFDIPSSSLPSK